MQAVGIELGDNLRPGSGKNPTGFFEDRDLLTLNKRLKRLLGIRGDSVRLIDAHEWDTAPMLALRDEAVELIRRRFGGQPLWGYKYGRTLRMLPFWMRVYETLGLDMSYVVALRNPLSVARSRARLDPHRGTQEKSDLEWLVNIVPYFRMVRGSRIAVVDYDLVMADPVAQLERMARLLGLPLTDTTRASIRSYRDEFLKPEIRHSRFSLDDLTSNERVNHLTRDAFAWLYRVASDDLSIDHDALWTDWERLERELARLGPILRHVDRVEEELRQAQRSPFGPLQAIPPLWRNYRSR
jgi:hypothetical protein